MEHWLHGGETSLENTVLLCSAHHWMVHEGGWTVTAGADDRFAFESPAGRWVSLLPSGELVSDAAGWLREWAEENDLDLGSEVNAPLGDGKKPNYALAVDALLAAGE